MICLPYDVARQDREKQPSSEDTCHLLHRCGFVICITVCTMYFLKRLFLGRENIIEEKCQLFKWEQL